MFNCRISGLCVCSDIELPGVIPVLEQSDRVDVRIRLRKVPEQLTVSGSAVTRGPVWELDERRFLLSLPGIGRFLATDGATLDLDPHTGTDPADALPFALGTGFSALLLQRGGMVLHASAVIFEGRAFAFCGNSGAGKSTLAAALCRLGCRFVNDDLCSVELDRQGDPAVWPDGKRLKLCEESISHLDLAGNRRDAVRAGTGKFYVEPPDSGSAGIASIAGGPIPLAALYILASRLLSNENSLELLSPLDAAQALLNYSYRPRLSVAMARKSRQAELTAAIVQRVPVYRLFRPRDLGHVACTATELLTRWQTTASTAAC